MTSTPQGSGNIAEEEAEKDPKRQRVREFAVRLCVLLMPEIQPQSIFTLTAKIRAKEEKRNISLLESCLLPH